MKKFMTILMISVLTLVGCAKEDANEVKLLGTTWVKEADAALPVITLNFSESRVNGFSGVNRFFADCKIGKKSIELASVGVTRMQGSPEAMQVEKEFLDNLELVNNYKLKDGVLKFYNDNKEILVLTAFNLVGTNWKLNRTAIENEEGLYRLTQEVAPTLSFDADGKYYGNDGINNFFGSYITVGGNLAFTAEGSTMAAGAPDDMAAADSFNALLAKTVTYLVNGTTMTLYDIDGKALLEFHANVVLDLEEVPVEGDPETVSDAE